MIAERMRPFSRVVAGEGGQGEIRLTFLPEEAEIRTALRDWRARLRPLRLGFDLEGRAEIVLAEVLNNIAEHGHHADIGAPVELLCRGGADGLHFVVTDHGRPPPPDMLRAEGKAARCPDSGDIAALPEGGFGWFLIRELTCDLSLHNGEGGNRLCFRVPREMG